MSPSALIPSARPLRLCLLLCALLAFAPGPGYSQEADGGVGVPIDLVIEGGPEGTIDARITEGIVAVNRAQLADALASILDQALLARLRVDGADQAMISLADIEALGIGARFDPARIRVVIRVPADARQPRRVALSRLSPGLPRSPWRCLRSSAP